MPPKPRPPLERFWKYVRKNGPNGCWEWTGGKHASGYGSFSIRTGTKIGAHRFAYASLVGPIPGDMELDHLCRNPSCVRPDHLEPVTHQENSQRGMTGLARGEELRTRTHCPRGHPYDEENTYRNRGERTCRECGRVAARIYQRRKRRERAAQQGAQRHG